MITTQDMMDYLVARRTPNQPAAYLAEIFERLIWLMDDNGTEIDAVCRTWLNGDNEDKVAIALAMTESYPASSREEMQQLFQRITARWPLFAPRCQEILNAWDEQFGHKPPVRTEKVEAIARCDVARN